MAMENMEQKMDEFLSAPDTGITCPFCNEDSFDKIGLKIHFRNGHCDVYNSTPMSDEEEEE